MKNLTVAGAAALLDLDAVRQAFAAIGWDARFVEAPFMRRYGKVDACEEAAIDFTPTLPLHIPAMPMSEYWLSRCLKKAPCTLSYTALAASRSKRLLYERLSHAAPTPHVFEVHEAERFIKQGGQVVVKPDGLFSGYGVKVVTQDNAVDLLRYVQDAAQVKSMALKLMEAKSSLTLITERIQGDEYSADAFFYRGEVSLVRVCYKAQVLIHSSPCTAVYQLISPTAQMEAAIASWCSALFDEGDISFAQFDFVRTLQGDLVPLDFACRVGGGFKHLLRLASGGKSPYAGAITQAANKAQVHKAKICGAALVGAHTPLAHAAALGCAAEGSFGTGESRGEAINLQEGLHKSSTDGAILDALADRLHGAEGAELCWTQLNVLPVQSGQLVRGDWPQPKGDVVILKRVGDSVIRCPSSSESRIATVVCRLAQPVSQDVIAQLLIGKPYIAPWSTR